MSSEPPILSQLAREAGGWFRHDPETQEGTPVTTPAVHVYDGPVSDAIRGLSDAIATMATRADRLRLQAAALEGDRLIAAAIAARDAGVSQDVRDSLAATIAKITAAAAPEGR